MERIEQVILDAAVALTVSHKVGVRCTCSASAYDVRSERTLLAVVDKALVALRIAFEALDEAGRSDELDEWDCARSDVVCNGEKGAHSSPSCPRMRRSRTWHERRRQLVRLRTLRVASLLCKGRRTLGHLGVDAVGE